ncbi:DNA-directed RNA polymerase III subunit, putative [Candida dubliniensis CD36]|uniref:DNA-directed RNA polymerase III subunit RPC6 n=1 Tax=Candida dubliniensis (strain CD36 / ATCC MYA-646 / CBS 7987 / NCPF 3949 / NRRL Y-17841) TaxID=573826 RepID=B9WJ38_CANDC|nr:DNA-directed RNA polymerase III subunit, putative [Candida dubliniensis CD36]CAX41258.1 DNA-directed RNA polymerase III subunit, putative [Candida dubliniensis CD36]
MSGVLVSDKARHLYTKMREYPNSKLFDQDELQTLFDIKKGSELMEYLQELVNGKYVKISKMGDQLKFQTVAEEEAKKVSSMSDDEAMIYSYIEASGREGIWTKTIKAKTNLHQHIVQKCLKNLENNRYIKSIKSVKHPTRKIYMLYNLQPSIDVTGGPWFTDSELDTEFIETLLEVCWRFIVGKTMYIKDENADTEDSNPLQTTYHNHHPGVNLDQLVEFINNSNITSVELGINDIRSLCDVLIYDDRIEEVGGNQENSGIFKATWQSIIDKGNTILQNNYQDLKNAVSDDCLNYLQQNQSDFSVFQYKSTIQDLQDESDLVYLDSWMNE